MSKDDMAERAVDAPKPAEVEKPEVKKITPAPEVKKVVAPPEPKPAAAAKK